ncbi:hypothetical protein GCM10027347_59960 [Larkinella harenae]
MKKYTTMLGAKTIIKDQSLIRHEEIRKKITILPELEALIPPLHPTEFTQLTENIRKDGCREALLVWETTELEPNDAEPAYILIDGHNRYSICQQYGLPFKIHLVSFDSMADVQLYMIDNQLGRRNLTPEQSSYLRGMRYLSEKGEKGKYDRQEHKGQNVPSELSTSENHKGQNDPYDDSISGSTSERLAQRFNVSEKTIKRDAEFARGLSRLGPNLRTSILSGQAKVTKGVIQQLSRLEQPHSPLETLPELTSLFQDLLPPPIVSDPSTDEMVGLKKQLAQLIRKLDRKPAKGAAVCDEIIRCSQQLKQLLEAK